MSGMTIEVERREALGKNANRRLRAAGVVPAIVYGGGRDSVAIGVDRKLMQDCLRSGGENAVFLLKLADTSRQRHVMIRDIQAHPLNGELIHIDFQRIEMTEKVRVKVPVELVGVAIGVKNEGAMLDFVTREVEVECLPTAIPNNLELDVSELHAGQHVEASDVELPEGVELAGDTQDRVIVSVVARRAADVAEEEAAEEELLEAEQEEPEVIRRGKGEEEEA